MPRAQGAVKNLLPLQPGDVPDTFADVQELVRDVGYKPATPIETGVKAFIDWYRGYYHVLARAGAGRMRAGRWGRMRRCRAWRRKL